MRIELIYHIKIIPWEIPSASDDCQHRINLLLSQIKQNNPVAIVSGNKLSPL